MEMSWMAYLIPLFMFLFLLSIPFLDTLVPIRWSVSFLCPDGKGQVDAIFVGPESLGISRAVDVCACSAVPDMLVAACGKRCLKGAIGPPASKAACFMPS